MQTEAYQVSLLQSLRPLMYVKYNSQCFIFVCCFTLTNCTTFYQQLHVVAYILVKNIIKHTKGNIVDHFFL